jgi:hypothetical protein
MKTYPWGPRTWGTHFRAEYGFLNLSKKSAVTYLRVAGCISKAIFPFFNSK